MPVMRMGRLLSLSLRARRMQAYPVVARGATICAKTTAVIRMRRHGIMLRKVTDLKDAERLKELIAPSVFNLDGDRLSYLFDTVYASPRRHLYVWEEDGKPVGILGIERVGR